MPDVLLEARGVGKRFPGVVALDGVDCAVHRGECLAVVGENGAGKSTLMKILAGVYQPDSGELFLDGRTVRFPTPLDAMNAGISLIHQELNLAENLSVLDNLALGREATTFGPLRLLDRRGAVERGQSLLERVGLSPNDASRPVGDLAPGQKQLVEIARALGLQARLLIMDEPTSSLTQKETDRLYEVIDQLKADGVAVLYISHRLAEIRRCCDRAVVLRDGKNAGGLAKGELTHDRIVRLMVGRDLKSLFPRNHRKPDGAAVLALDGVTYDGGPAEPVSFEVKAGEVLGMGGLVGAGRTELAEAIFGLRRVTGGTVKLDGEAVCWKSPGDAVRSGVFLVPEDRRHHGLVLESAVGFNLSLPNLDRLAATGIVDRRSERDQHADSIRTLGIKTPNAEQLAGLLSGGNQQKIVFAKWLARGPKLLILDEPTRGVDVGAKSEIYALIDELAGRGVAVWMITSDLEELLGVADRAIVLHEGRASDPLPRERLTEEAVMTLATGGLLP